MQIETRPPIILQIFREPLKPGTEVMYDALEQEQARATDFHCRMFDR